MTPQVVKARREAGARVAGALGATAGADQAAAIAAAAAYQLDQQQGRASRRGGTERVMADAVKWWWWECLVLVSCQGIAALEEARVGQGFISPY